VLYTFDQFVLDTNRFEISRHGDALRTEPQVIELLTFLLRNRDRVVSREHMIEAVWKGRVVSDTAISQAIKNARKLLGDDGRQQKFIRTIRKKGFAFVAPVEESVAVPLDDGIHTPRRLEASAAPGSDARPSVGVLGFSVPNDNADRGHFADGLTEDLITTLSKVSRLTVVSYPQSPQGDSRVADARRAGEEMQVDYVLCGSVRSDADRLRISARLVDVGSGQCLWAHRYECANEKMFDLQDEITRKVVSALQVELTEGEQALLLSRGTQNIEAWQLTFQGQAAVLDHKQAGVRRGLQQIEAALALDADYALAWSALAVAHWKESLNEGWSESREASLQRAVEASDRALALEPENAAILAMRSLIFVSHRNFDEALKLAKQALHHAGSAANTTALAGIALRACCEPEPSIRHTRKAMALCPIYPAWYPYGIAVCYWMMGELDRALEYAAEAVGIDAGFSLNYFALALIHAESGNIDEASAAVDSLLEIDPGFSSRAYIRGMPFSDPAVESRRDAALKRAGMPE
jgi:TolB-like protein